MLRLNTIARTYSAEFKHRTFGRIHIHLRTTVKAVAMARHTALEQLLDTGEPVRDVVDALRQRKITIEAVAECVRAKRPFDSLRASVWPTLGDAKEQYLAWLSAKAKDSGTDKTLLNATTALTHAVEHFGADQRLEAITEDQMVAYKAWLAAKIAYGSKGRALHSNTIGLYLTKFGALYTFLQRRETRRAQQAKRTPSILFVPLDRKEHVPESVTTRVRFLTDDEADALLTVAPWHYALAIALGIFAGLRVGEVAMLRPRVDVDVERRMLYVQGRDGWAPKYRRNREVPITDALLPSVEAHLAQMDEGEPYLFKGQSSGTPITVHQLQHVFTDTVRDAGLTPGRDAADGVTFHTLRHTFASWLVMGGADLFTVARLMGHTSTKQIEATYAHLSPEHRRATVDLLTRRWNDRSKHSTETG